MFSPARRRTTCADASSMLRQDNPLRICLSLWGVRIWALLFSTRHARISMENSGSFIVIKKGSARLYVSVNEGFYLSQYNRCYSVFNKLDIPIRSNVGKVGLEPKL